MDYTGNDTKQQLQDQADELDDRVELLEGRVDVLEVTPERGLHQVGNNAIGIPNLVWTRLNHSAAPVFQSAALSLNTSTGVVTVNTAGVYSICCFAHFNNLTTVGKRAMRISGTVNQNPNTGNIIAMTQGNAVDMNSSVSGTRTPISVSGIAYFNALDTMSIEVWHDTGRTDIQIRPANGLRTILTITPISFS
jgi:hypothetical protein